MWKKVVIIAVAIMLLSSAFPLHQAMGQTTTISVEPPGTFGLLPGDTFLINITVSNVADLYAWQVYLYYQRALLNGTTRFNEGTQSWEPAIDPGPFLGPKDSYFFVITTFTDDYNATHGLMYISATLIGAASGVTGSGTLATINFTTVGYGGSILHLDKTKLADSNIDEIPHTTIDGEVYAGVVNVAIGKIDTSLTIPQGSVALINATAQNKGQVTETFDVTLSYDGNPIDGTKTVVNLPGGGSEILNFSWDTTFVPIGQYNLTATATTVPGETDMGDNTLIVTVQVGMRDLAIFNLTPRTIVGQGYTVRFNVTVQNNGQIMETANVTLYVDSDAIGNATGIVAGGAQEIFRFTWNATEVQMGNHNMTAYIWPVPFETDTTNNNYTQTVHVGIPGDVSSATSGVQDGKVDMRDISYLVLRFNSKWGFPNWKPNADINDDGVVNMRDISIAILNFNKHE